MSWCILVLGVAHCLVVIVNFRKSISQAASEGLFGRFASYDERGVAFMSLLFGILLTMAGHAAIVSVAAGNLPMLKLIAAYVLAASIIGVIAMPKSPFVVGANVSAALLVTSSLR